MKKSTLFTIILATIASILFTSCAQEITNPPNITTATSTYESIIEELEQKIIDIQQNHYISESESKKQIAELKSKIDELRSESKSTTAQQTTVATTLPEGIFIYSLSDGKAIIDGYTGKEDHLVVPSQVDGFDVYGISSKAFEGYSFKSVIISDGVESIDWFAFYNCKQLTSITIPSSVRKIGYAVFDGCPKNFTIYCQSGSFAQSYAKSYGITNIVV